MVAFTISRKQRILLGLSLANAIFMLWLAFFLLSIPYVLPDEYVLVRYSSVTKNLILGLEEKPDTNRFLFINVAWDKVLADKYDPLVPGYTIGNEPITDRAKLVGLLQLLQANPNYEFLVLDIYLIGNTDHDSSLTALINSMDNVLVSYHRDDADVPQPPDLKIKHIGLSDIEKVDDKCLKFKIFFNDSLKTTPLLMYEKVSGKKFDHRGLFYSIGKKSVLNSFILDYRIRNFDYMQNRYPKVHLGEWINPAYQIFPTIDESIFDQLEDLEGFEEEGGEGETSDSLLPAEDDLEAEIGDIDLQDFPEEDLPEPLPEEGLEEEFSEFDEGFGEEEAPMNWANEYDPIFLDSSYVQDYIYGLTQDRVIFVGDFEDRDVHETIYGDTPGPIILLDAFLALEEGDNQIRIPFVTFLFISFLTISYITFRYRTVYGSWLRVATFTRQRKESTLLENLTVYLIYFGLVSIITFFLFNIHISVLVLAFYMYSLEKARNYVVDHFKKKNTQAS